MHRRINSNNKKNNNKNWISFVRILFEKFILFDIAYPNKIAGIKKYLP